MSPVSLGNTDANCHLSKHPPRLQKRFYSLPHLKHLETFSVLLVDSGTECSPRPSLTCCDFNLAPALLHRFSPPIPPSAS